MVKTESGTTPWTSRTDIEVSYDSDCKEYHLDHDWREDTSIGSKIVLALEEITGAEIHDLDRLHDSINPDALNELFRPLPDGPVRDTGLVSFTYSGYVVTVYGTGRIEISRM